jgi:hypothetical protein
MRPTRPILINLPLGLLANLDEAATVLRLTRTDVIRRSLLRDLDYVVRYELQRTLEHRQKEEEAYLEWVVDRARDPF